MAMASVARRQDKAVSGQSMQTACEWTTKTTHHRIRETEGPIREGLVRTERLPRDLCVGRYPGRRIMQRAGQPMNKFDEQKVALIGIDLGKRLCCLHGQDKAGKVAFCWNIACKSGGQLIVQPVRVDEPRDRKESAAPSPMGKPAWV